MNCLTIATMEEPVNLRNKFIKLLPSQNQYKINLRYDKTNYPSGGIHYIEMSYSDSCNPDIKNQFAGILTECIIEKYESKLISKILNTRYYYLLKYEKDAIKINVINILNTVKKNRKKIIKAKLAEFLETSNQLIMEGFIKFRLKEYLAVLEDATEEAVNAYYVEREYDEFIELLKYFVEIQDVHMPFLHIISKKNGYAFYDKEGQDITKDCLEDFISEVMTNNVNFDDLLVSTLIVLSPQKILWHKSNTKDNKELIETVKRMFDEKLSFCEGCEFCDNPIL